MIAWIRRMPAVTLALVGLVCAGCLTQKPYDDVPPAQLEPRPPQPITTALPPVAEGQGTRAAERGLGATRHELPPPLPIGTNSPAAMRQQPSAPASSLADLIMGRTPPPPNMPPVAPPATSHPGKTNASALVRSGAGGLYAMGTPQLTDRKPNPENGHQPALPGTQHPEPNAPSRAPSSASLSTPLSLRQTIALQTLLDRHNFSCNCADGRIGFRTRAALRAWQETHGLPPTGLPDAATLAELGDLDHAYTSYTITAEDHAQLTRNPTTWLGRSQIPRLGYTTILETIAERGHATQQAIRDLNPQVTAWPDPPAGTTVTIPDVGPTVTGKPAHAAHIKISIGGKLVRVFDGAGNQLAQFPCSIARDPKKREPCEISVVAIAPNPNYIFDPALFTDDPESATLQGKLLIPPGPRNPVGIAWVGLSKTGYGIHGTPKPEDIGKTESHGCFRLANWNALKLLHLVEIGTPVTVEE